MFEPAMPVPVDRKPGAWFEWTRGKHKLEGSATAFDDCMQVVSKAHATLNNQPTFSQLRDTQKALRGLLIDTMPAWTHRRQSTQAPMPDARESYVHGLYCYTRGAMHEAMAATTADKVTPITAARAWHNAAHLKLVGGRLMGIPQAADEARLHKAESHACLATHYENECETTGRGMGTACAHQALAAQLDAKHEPRLRALRARNTNFEEEEDTLQLHLVLP